MKLNWNFISKIFARTVGVENLSRDAEGHEVLSADQRKILEQKFGPEALQHYDAYAASDANDDAQQEQLLLNFLDAIGRSGGDDKDKLRQELAKAEEKIASMSALMTILQQEKEKLAKAREDKPAATEVFGRSEGRTFTIDAKASHNRLALEALATGQLPTFSAATIDVDDLKKELGTYSSQGNSLELMQDIYRGFTSAKFMTPKRAIETYKAVRSDYTSVVQEFSAKWTPSGDARFTAIKIQNYRHKINFAIVPADVANSWLLSLYNERLSPDQMPITRYIVQKILLPSILQDIEMKMIGKGKYKAKENPTDAGKPEESMNGIETLLVEAAKSGDKGINFYPNAKDLRTATDAEVVEYIDDFAHKILAKYQSLKMNIFLSADLYVKYKRGYKDKWGAGSGTENPDFGKDRVDFTNFSLQVLDCLYGSPIIFCTPKSNFIMLQNLNQPQVITDIQKVDYEVRYYGEFWLGVGFAFGEMLFASVPADYDPQAAISDDGSTDFWKKTNAAAEVEDTHEGAWYQTLTPIIMYNPVSILKTDEGAGCPRPKNPTIILVPVEFVAAEPTREIGDIVMKSDLELIAEKKAIGIYATPSTIECTEESEGDPDARGVKVGIAFEHPGDSAEIAGFTEYARNRGFIALNRDCANGNTAKYRGSKCNPLFLTTEYTNNKDARKRKLTFKQEQRDLIGASIYKGKMPELADEATSAPTEEEGA